MSSSGNFVELTESWGMPMPQVQHDMVFRRYDYFAELVEGGDALEVGAGQGLGNAMLAGRTRSLVSCDIELENCRQAAAHGPGDVVVADAQQLPFADDSFDAAAACEMIYYVPDQTAMVAEMQRVLRRGGRAFLACANPQRPSFHKSPFSTHYPSAAELYSLLDRSGFDAEVFGVFPLDQSLRGRVLRLVSGAATKLHLVPKTLAGRGLLKKIFFGELTPFTGLEAAAQRQEDIPNPIRIDHRQVCSSYRVIYAVGRKR